MADGATPIGARDGGEQVREKIAEQAGCNNHVNALGHENCAGRTRIDRHRLHADLRHVSHDLLDDLVSEGMTAFDHVAEHEPKRALHRQFGRAPGDSTYAGLRELRDTPVL